MDGRDAAIRVEGLREFRRALKRVSPELDRELRGEMKDIAATVATEAKMRAPRLTGEYAQSIRPYVRAARVSVGSRLPQAGVVHWGGTIRPRGVPILFPRRAVILEAADRQQERTMRRIENAVERSANRAGWHTT